MTHSELEQFRLRFGEQLRAARPRLYGADDRMTDAVVQLEALKSTLQAYDWSNDVREQAADYCGVEITPEALIAMRTSAAYRGQQ